MEDTTTTEYKVEMVAKKEKAKPVRAEGHLTVDVFDDGDELVVRSTIAGVSQEDIDIAVTTDMVTIKGTRTPPEMVKPSDYYHQELYWGPFSRSIILPEDVDPDKAKASMKNGILTVRLPKLASSKVKRIRISD